MTEQEATKIANICATADDGCKLCVSSLAAKLTDAFPQFEWVLVAGDDNESTARMKVTNDRPHGVDEPAEMGDKGTPSIRR